MIAQRTLQIGSNALVVSIGKPEEYFDDHRCHYCLNISGKRKVGYVVGVDSVQAIQLTLKRINSEILATQEDLGLLVSWLDCPPGHHGFDE